MPRAWRKRQEEFALQGQRSRFIALASTERAATKALTRCQGAIAFLIGDFCNKIGTSRTSRDVRFESAKWAKADIGRLRLIEPDEPRDENKFPRPEKIFLGTCGNHRAPA